MAAVPDPSASLLNAARPRTANRVRTGNCHLSSGGYHLRSVARRTDEMHLAPRSSQLGVTPLARPARQLTPLPSVHPSRPSAPRVVTRSRQMQRPDSLCLRRVHSRGLVIGERPRERPTRKEKSMTSQSTQPAVGTTHMRSAAGLESFDCYRLAVNLAATAPGLVPRGHAALRDQLERASTSVALNLAEGWGHWQARQKVQFYTIARGSVLESGAAIDLLRARGLADASDCEQARALCTRIGQMLSGLIRSVERRARR
jgi:four helix bundle protein